VFRRKNVWPRVCFGGGSAQVRRGTEGGFLGILPSGPGSVFYLWDAGVGMDGV
jgi:hypothetical protein